MTDIQENLARLIAPCFAWDVFDEQGNWLNHYVRAQAMEAAAQIMKAYPRIVQGDVLEVHNVGYRKIRGT